MGYDFTLSIIFYLCGCFYMVFSAAVIAKFAKSHMNWLYVSLVSVLAIWAFAHSISISAPTAESSVFWRTFSVFGWGTFSSFLLHFILVFTKIEKRLNKRRMMITLYLPALINIFLFGPFGLFVEKQYQMVRTDFGWLNVAPMYGAKIWLNAYYIIFSLLSIILLLYWWKEIKSHGPAKRTERHFIVSVLLLFMISIVAELLPELLEKRSFPQTTVVFLMVPTILLFGVLRKTGLLTKYGKTFRLREHSENLTDDRTRLFKMVTVIFEIGAALSFLVGYYGMQRSLQGELFLAGFLLAIGVTVRLIPVMTKKHAVQNTIFLVISTYGMLHLIIKEAERGALTIWAVYILFMILNVILDGTFQAYIFAAISVLIQLVFWKVRPDVSVVITRNDYVVRMFIILLSFFAVRFVTAEYALKVKEYKRFAKEQEVLERISSNFISLNRDNVLEKIDEMLETAAEILEYDYAYLVEFDKDYQEVTILNRYLKDNEHETFPYYPGMKLTLADLPSTLTSLINWNAPIMCEDIAGLLLEEADKKKEYFGYEEINSFISVPIMIEDKVIGSFLIEYKKQIDRSLAENRLNILKIIANLLGDAKKKTLYEERLYDFAYFDEDTKLFNSNMLKIRLEQLINSKQEAGKIAVINIELENLRMINDTFGHHIGKQVVIKAATLLEHLFEECCVLSKTGDGEFVVVLPDVKKKEEIEACAKSLLASFSRPILTETGIEALHIVPQIGIAVYPDDGKDADMLLKNADLARYEAKDTNGKIVFYTERLENHIAENTLLTNRLFKALDNQEFFLVFQPQISCNTGKTVGVEALLRWTDGNQTVTPSRFIPILEQTGLIYDVGLWVLEQALQEHNRLSAKGFPSLRISVNLSVVQLQGEDFIGDIKKIIDASGVNPKLIDMEITENWFSEDFEDVVEKLHQLKELGVNIAIDDFGKGYSSFNRLNRVPFDRIKIDKDIIDYIDIEMNKAPITETIVSLARAFKAGVTAEGVETKEQVDFLKSIACDEIQGYYFSRPLSAEALEGFLEKEMLQTSFDELRQNKSGSLKYEIHLNSTGT
jgi:diguanylate cyclase (GGDEF)-like protein